MTMLNRECTHPIRTLLFLSLLILFASQLFIQSVLAQEDLGVIVAGVPANFPPQYYFNEETGESYGFAIDVMDEIAARSGLEIRYVVYDTCAESLVALQEGEIDVLPNIGVTHEREEYLDYTTSVEVFNIGIIVRSSTMDIQSFDDLSGRDVTAVSKEMGRVFLEEHEDINLHVSSTVEEALFSLISGETDAFVYPTEQVLRIAIQSGIDDHIKVVGEPLLEVKRAIAVREGQTELLNVLDEEVKAFVVTPEYREIYSKWYGESEPYWNVERVAIVMGSILVLVVVLLVSWHYFSVLRLNKSLKSSMAERKRTEEKLKKYTEELKHSNELKDLFTDIMRHDLLNPASVIKGYTEMLIDMGGDEKKVERLHKIESSNEKLIDIIETAAKLAKLESVEELEFETKDIAIIIGEVADNFRLQLENKQMEFEFNAEGTYPANVNPVIEEVFANLLSNAIKYSPQKSKIIVDIDDAGENWKVTVTDFGDGISDEDKTLLFERFKRLNTGYMKGTGLGLAIVKRIIELHGGSAGVEDNPAGKGSAFWVTVRKNQVL